MSKFNRGTRTVARGPFTTAEAALTAEGGLGAVRDPKSALFLLAASNMVSEETFYEGAAKRDARFRGLILNVAQTDPDWLARFVSYLRGTLLMRSASLVLAAEYARSRLRGTRAVISGACQRPDEPAELLAYWLSHYGRKLPMAFKRGLSDAARRLYTERAALKWDSARSDVRMADVIELSHCKPSGPWQSDLFKFLLDRRHKRENPRVGASLPLVRRALQLEALEPAQRREALADPKTLADAGFTWERLSGWLPGGMDAQAWESVIPSMGVMALLRNLRNFDEAGLSEAAVNHVCRQLTHPDEIRAARVFPLRYLSALKAVASLRYAAALENGVQATLANVPVLPGRTLVMIDNSSSMAVPLSSRSSVTRAQVAGLFGAALALRCESAVAVAYESQILKLFEPKGGEAVLKVAQELGRAIGGTNTWELTRLAFRAKGPFDRIVILTDEQAHDTDDSRALAHVPVYTFNLAGHEIAHAEERPNRMTIGGGLTDSAFILLKVLDDRRDGSWPF